MQVAFYEGANPLQVVPRLVDKIYQQGQRGVVWIPNVAIYQAVHDVLWTFSKTTFIPHGGKADGIPAGDQPFWLTTHLENPNEAIVLVGVDMPAIDVDAVRKLGFERVVDIFETVTDVQTNQYTAYTKANVTPQWWLNTSEGWKPKEQTLFGKVA